MVGLQLTPDRAGCKARLFWHLQHDSGHLGGSRPTLVPWDITFGPTQTPSPSLLKAPASVLLSQFQKGSHRLGCAHSALHTVIHATGSKDSPRHTPFPAQTRGTHCVLSRGSWRQCDLSLLCRGELGVSCGKEHSPPRACSPLHGQRSISFLWNFPANPLSRARPQRGYSLFLFSTVFPDLLNTHPQTLTVSQTPQAFSYPVLPS